MRKQSQAHNTVQQLKNSQINPEKYLNIGRGQACATWNLTHCFAPHCPGAALDVRRAERSILQKPGPNFNAIANFTTIL
jgi:hypothetical protein